MQRVLRHTAGRIALTVAAILILVALILFLGSLKNIPPAQYVQLTVDGIRAGSIYALIALGFVVIYSVTGIINFAQGEFVMLGAMSSVAFYNLGLSLPSPLKMFMAVILSVVCVAIIGAVVERMAIYPARRASVVTLIIITIGVALAIRALALIIWGADPYFLPAFTTLKMEDLTFRIGGVALKAQSFWIWGTVAVVLAALAFFFERTIMGKALRACAVNRRAAELMGINPSRMSLLSFALAAALGAIGGIVLAPTLRPIYDMGLKLGLKGFVAAVMGGLVSSPGAVVGGLILGVAENVGAGVTKAGLKDIISLIILVLILLFRPQGIIGGVERGAEEM
ncbi:MAG: branched-chain amino acid ABC transporter permease [Anaerolineae bacterium]